MGGKRRKMLDSLAKLAGAGGSQSDGIREQKAPSMCSTLPALFKRLIEASLTQAST